MINENIKKDFLSNDSSIAEVIANINSLRKEVEFVNELQNQEINKKMGVD